jgi:hypothetical protein
MRKNIKKIAVAVSLILASISMSTLPARGEVRDFSGKSAKFFSASTVNGANISDVKVTNFSYDSKKDLQLVTISWKASRNNSFEISTSIDGATILQSFKHKTGTSIQLQVPADSVVKVLLRADKYPDHIIEFAFESPLRFNNLLFSDLRSCLQNTPTNSEDRTQLWQVLKNRKLTGYLGVFLLVAPNALNSTPGTSLSEALASSALATLEEIKDPLDFRQFSKGLAFAAEVGSRGYFASRCMP